MAKAKYSSEALRAMTELRAVVHDDRYVVESIVQGGEFLYDPQVFWNWDPSSSWSRGDNSILISDIGGQGLPETGWASGHGAIYRLHADDRFEAIMPPGLGRQPHLRAGTLPS